MTLKVDGTSWRRLRKAGGEALNKSVVHRYEDLQITESLILVAGMLNSSHTWSAQFRRAGASSTLTMVYGVPPTLQEDDPTVVAIGDSANIQTTAAIQGAHWVEYFPWMKYIPSRYCFITLNYTCSSHTKTQQLGSLEKIC